MKAVFGTWWQRLLGSSATLSPFEVALLATVVRALPDPLCAGVDAHIDAATLVQRYLVKGPSGTTEWRGLLFYRQRGDSVPWSGVTPLAVGDGTVKLLRLKLRVGSGGPLLTITAHAHRRYFFDILSSEDWRPVRRVTDLRVENVSPLPS